MSEWQPIETAPSDGRQVLVSGGQLLNGVVEIRGADGDWWRWALKDGYRSLPTHWMPLPPPPSAPGFKASQNSAERDPSVMPDCPGAELPLTTA